MAAALCFITSETLPLSSLFQGPISEECNLLTRYLLCPQAKYLAQIIVMGVQVVGRAFARALRQEFAGKCEPLAPPGLGVTAQVTFSYLAAHHGPIVNAGTLCSLGFWQPGAFSGGWGASLNFGTFS